MPDQNGNPIPGERLASAIINGEIDGARIGQGIFSLLPTLPHESLFPMPRFMLPGASQPLSLGAQQPAQAQPLTLGVQPEPVINHSPPTPAQLSPVVQNFSELGNGRYRPLTFTRKIKELS